jgi:hypothetical protein
MLLFSSPGTDLLARGLLRSALCYSFSHRDHVLLSLHGIAPLKDVGWYPPLCKVLL